MTHATLPNTPLSVSTLLRYSSCACVPPARAPRPLLLLLLGRPHGIPAHVSACKVQLLLRAAWRPQQQYVSLLPEGCVNGCLHTWVDALPAW